MSSSTSIQATNTGTPKTPKQFPIKLVGGSLAILGTLLAITNPGKPAYYQYVTDKFMEPLAESESCEEFEQKIGLLKGAAEIPTKDLCKFAIGGFTHLARPVVKEALKSATNRRNLGLFSIYTTEVPGKKVQTIGIAKQFITFPGQ